MRQRGRHYYSPFLLKHPQEFCERPPKRPKGIAPHHRVGFCMGGFILNTRLGTRAESMVLAILKNETLEVRSPRTVLEEVMQRMLAQLCASDFCPQEVKTSTPIYVLSLFNRSPPNWINAAIV